MKNLLIKSESISDNLDIKYADVVSIQNNLDESYESLYESLGLVGEQYDLVYGYGDKKVIDFTKFISKMLGCNYVLIPTILEHDNIFRSKITDLNNNFSTYYIHLDPLKIIIDDNILKKVEIEKQSAGWACIIASLTACYAWRNYPHYFKMEYDSEIDFEINTCVSKIKAPDSEENRRELCNALKIFVDIENTFDTNIFKESAEHYFVYNLSKYTNLNCQFGEALALGILVISHIINIGLAKRAHHCMNKAGLKCFLPSKKILIKTLSTLKDFVEDNELNYSVINTKKFYLADLNSIIDKVYLMGLDLNHKHEGGKLKIY